MMSKMESTSYCYDPISKTNAIRLLNLDTINDSADIITCRIMTTSLDRAPPFFALSYRWGTCEQDTPILVKDPHGGRRLRVTEPLAIALRRLQKLSNHDIVKPEHSPRRRRRRTFDSDSSDEYVNQMSLSQLMRIIKTGFHPPRCRDRLYQLAKELPMGSEGQEIVLGYLRTVEKRGYQDYDPTAPRSYTREELLPLLEQLVQIEEGRKDENDEWDLSCKWFWIDQICINQGDVEEKGNQVKLMASIYKRAIRTLIWVGDDCGDAQGAFNLADQIHDVSEKQIRYGGVLDAVSTKSHAATGLPPIHVPEWAALGRLLSKSWFNRIWVVQEVVLSQRDPLLLYGQSIYSWRRFSRAASWLFKSRYDGLSVIPSQLMNVSTFSELQSQNPKWHLLAVLERTRNGFVASDPRDKVFGVGGLSVETQGAQCPPALDPDYNIPTEEVFRRVAKFLIESTCSLTVLSLECIGAESHGIPSWVPDLNGSSFYRGCLTEVDEGDDGCMELRHRSGYKAAFGLPLELAPNPDPKILALRGVLVDTVVSQLEENYDVSLGMQDFPREKLIKEMPGFHKATSDQMRFYGEANRLRPAPEFASIMDQGHQSPALLRIWMNMVEASRAVEPWDFEELARSFHRIITAGQNDSGSTFHSEEEYQESFSDCCAYLVRCADSYPYQRPPDFSVWREFLSWHCDSEDRDPDGFFAVARHVCVGRRFFRTAKGLMGMGPGSMQEGDCLSLLFGGNVPYILRPKDDRYLFIGDCFVDGIMEGQALMGIVASQVLEII
jgi:Heterokaryon incompatibility protein (HET)